MGKCLSCFHVRTTEQLPSDSNSFVENHVEKQEADLPTEVNRQDTHLDDDKNHLADGTFDKSAVSMSNGTGRNYLKSQSSSLASMQRSTRHSMLKRNNDNGSHSTAPSVSESKIVALFETYRDKDCTEEDAILADGIEQLCADLALSPDDVRILVFAWKLDAQQMCKFTRAEFTKLPELVNKCRDNAEEFKSLYRFTFRFGLDSSCGQRILPIDMAIILWKLVFSIRVSCDESFILTAWLNFLSQHTHVVRGIPRDTWNMFLTFYDTIGDDLSKYDDTEAWPSLLDDFVEYQTDRSNQNSSDATNRNKHAGNHSNEIHQPV
ncbi:hypothetical protein M8J75_009979 [Diaphorina citri]|nr:hypothetical protein M8J75_009979 [Diaphorina citri]